MTDDELQKNEKLGKSEGHLAQHGATLIENGYRIVPIIGGKKQPIEKGWQDFKAKKADLDNWLANGYRRSGGVGIIAKNTPAIDIDVRDEEIADQVEAYVREHLGDGAQRVGRAPKRLFMFRTDAPFPKMSSRKYRDFEGDEHQIEILGDGQQFVAYHIHPDTQAPYYWPNEDGPAHTKHADLISITREQAEGVITFFEQLAGQCDGWVPVTRQRRRQSDSGLEDDGLFGNMKTTITLEETREHLEEIHDYDNRDTWVAIGMALHFEYDATEEAFEVWCEWSENGAKYDERDQAKRWEGFAKEIDKPGKTMLGAAFIKDLRNKEVTARIADELPRLKESIFKSETVEQWRDAVAEVAKSEIDATRREELVSLAKKKIDRLLDAPMPIALIRKEMAYKLQRDDKIPGWLHAWVYDTENDEYYNLETTQELSHQGFGATFDHKALTKKDRLEGKITPTYKAGELALLLHVIDKVHGRRYGPGEPPIYMEEGQARANSYSENMIPKIPEKLTPQDKTNVRRVKEHIAHLLANETEQRLLLDWLSWVAQHPGKKIRFAVLLQGTQGDGKSFFARMMRVVMGLTNVRFLGAGELEAKFNAWTVGQCLTCIEEVRLQGHNRYDVLNSMKEIITNDDVSVTAKGKDPRPMRNVTNYMLFTNSQEALPLDDQDRRYMILFSRWQTKERLIEFMKKNPNYYKRLYAAIEQSPGAIRQWLLDHEQHEDFDPTGQAPETLAREVMIENARPLFIRDVREIIDSGESPYVTNEILVADYLYAKLADTQRDVPNEKAASAMLAKHGFVNLGRHFFKKQRHLIFSRDPDPFRSKHTGAFRSELIRERLEEIALYQKSEATKLDEDEM